MPVLKTSDPARPVPGAVVLDLGDLAGQAKRILADARATAQQVLADARARAEADVAQRRAAADEQGHREGHERGLEEGRAAGRQAALDELRPRLEQIAGAWSTALEAWEAERASMLLSAREQVLRFALELGRKVIHRQIEADPSIVADQLDRALAMVTRPTAVEIVIHPEDRVTVDELLPSLAERIRGATHATVREDASVGRGGCRVRTAGGEIDASITTQLGRISEALVGESRK